MAMPALAAEPCRLPTLGGETIADLEAAYMERGAELIACEAKRRLAVATHAAEHELERRAGERRRWWWPFWRLLGS